MKMAKTKWIDALMTADIKGAILGTFVMRFEAGKRYRIDENLFNIFVSMNVAAACPKADFVLNVSGDVDGQSKPFWGPAKDE
jgi:hypothetical protein